MHHLANLTTFGQSQMWSNYHGSTVIDMSFIQNDILVIIIDMSFIQNDILDIIIDRSFIQNVPMQQFCYVIE